MAGMRTKKANEARAGNCVGKIMVRFNIGDTPRARAVLEAVEFEVQRVIKASGEDAEIEVTLRVHGDRTGKNYYGGLDA